MLRTAPRALLLASAVLFGAAYFALRFPDVQGAQIGVYLSTLLIAAPPVVALFQYLGARRALLSLLALSAFAYAIESVGVATGFPYGDFYYGDALGPKLVGLAPLLLPVTYVPLVLGAVAAAHSRRSTLRTLEAAVLLTLTDAVLDPGAAILGFWVWPEGGAYYGIPLTNYLGWMVSGALAAALLLSLGRRWGRRPRPGLLDGLILSLAFWTGAAVFSGLPVPALLGAALLAYLLRRRFRLAAGRYKPGA